MLESPNEKVASYLWCRRSALLLPRRCSSVCRFPTFPEASNHSLFRPSRLTQDSVYGHLSYRDVNSGSNPTPQKKAKSIKYRTNTSVDLSLQDVEVEFVSKGGFGCQGLSKLQTGNLRSVVPAVSFEMDKEIAFAKSTANIKNIEVVDNLQYRVRKSEIGMSKKEAGRKRNVEK